MYLEKIILLSIIAYANSRFIDEDLVLIEDVPMVQERRFRRQAQATWPIAGNPDGNQLSGIASIGAPRRDGNPSSFGTGLKFDHQNGHSATLGGTHFPGAGNQVTGAGSLNLYDQNKHKLDANAFVTHTMPHQGPNFNEYGGGLDYMYNKKIGAGLGIQHNDFTGRNDYSATGKWNVFTKPHSSLDLNAGIVRSTSPHFPSTWSGMAGGIYRF